MIAHRWDLPPAEAAALQLELRGAAREEPLDAGAVELVAGCDLSATRGRGDIHVALVVVRLLDLATVDEVAMSTTTDFPYVPGLLSFRELPPLLAAWERLSVRPDALLCDGHGRAHPRRLGLACHAGLLLDLPTIGCAKSRLVGTASEPASSAGSTAPLLDGEEEIGRVVRTRDGVKPIYVSVGHRSTLDDAVALALRCVGRYRLPEPTRRAHQTVGRQRRESER